MLKLNSRVHSFVTRQENELKSIQQQQNQQSHLETVTAVAAGQKLDSDERVLITATGNGIRVLNESSLVESGSGSVSGGGTVTTSASGQVMAVDYDSEMHGRLKDSVTEIYNCWDEAQSR